MHTQVLTVYSNFTEVFQIILNSKYPTDCNLYEEFDSRLRDLLFRFSRECFQCLKTRHERTLTPSVPYECILLGKRFNKELNTEDKFDSANG